MTKAIFAKARGPLGLLTAVIVVAAGMLFAPVAAASADTQLPGPAPIEQPNSLTVKSKPLPSVQIDSGVVWVQVIAGNTVFAGGSFSNARPAGAAPGTNLMPRSNILAYDINTGVATSFAPVINGQVKSMALSPDGQTLYVGGSFNSVNGVTRWNFAAFNVATGALLTTFQPAVGGSYVNAIVATSTTVYVAGLIGAGAGVTRKNFAAFKASNGALLSWAPTSDLQVDGMVINQSGDRIIAAGRFGTVNGVSQRGLAALDPVTGALLPWAASATVINGVGSGTNAGQAGIWSITIDKNNNVYGTGWVFADVTAGNLEGTFSADGETGDINWIADCHGDHYGVYSDGTNVYTTSHQHECSTMGGPPQSNPEATYMRNATDYTAAVKGTLTRSPYVSSIYADWEGYAAPAAIDWFPDWTTGSFTNNGQGQAGWDMTGNGTYLLVGGEFPYVDNTQQQGIARFSNATPDTDGPRLSLNTWTGMTAVSHAAGSVRVSIPSNWDRDDLTLTYKLYRNGTAAPIATLTGDSEYWNQPTITYTDTGQPAGSTQQYRFTATDPAGNVSYSNWLPVTVSSAAASAYATAVLNDGANLYWRLGTPTGTVESDWAGTNDGTIGSSVTPSTSGAIQGDTSGSAVLNGTSTSDIYTPNQVAVGSAYSMELWFKTTTTSGGKLAGYGSSSTGDSSNYDRHIYMTNDGRIVYGNYDGGTEVVESPTAYNDGNWHSVIGTQGPNGMALYIDGQLVGTQSATTAQAYTGYWRLGGDNLNGWPDQPSSENFSGQLDEFAVYPTALTETQASTHYALGYGAVAPTASFTDQVTNQSVAFDGTASTAPGGQTLTYSWNFGDGSAVSTVLKPVHTYAAAGTYPVVLTVTSSSGLTATSTQNVPIAAPHTLPVANIVSSTSGLTGTFDGSGSTPFDGATITGYQWTFGDGSTSTSAKPTHTYAAAGSYSVSLVVTDSQGATSATATTSVSVSHAAPVPSFTTTPSGLKVSVDGTATTASDGAKVTYDWDWGDGSAHGTGATASHTYGSAATYAITLTVTDSLGGTALKSSNVAVTHAAPVAAFTGSGSAFTVSVNGSTSSASDGATLTYDWNWGDGSAHGTGVSASHTYAGAGTNTVILTVTDSLGATATVTHSISTSHAAPVASFTTAPSALSLSVDGSASHASDGATLTYDWSWGDGTAHGTGVTATHNYSAAGTYTVTLTVTDSLGSSGTSSSSVMASQVVYVAKDDFARTVASGGWGSALIGGAWSASTGLSVSGGFGQINGAAGTTRSTYLGGTSVKDSDNRIQFANSVVANGGGTHFNFVARHTAAGDYHLKVRITSPGVVTVNLCKTVGTTETLLGATKVLSGYTYTPGAKLDLRFDLATSGSTTTLNGKVWPDGTTEPSAWTLTTTDSEPTLQVAGQIGVTTYVSGSVTNGPEVITVAGLTAQ